MSDYGVDTPPLSSPDRLDMRSPRGQTSPALKTERPASPKTIEDLETGDAGAGTARCQAKQTKRRAARACVSCRARKVRCDVVTHHPCGNCKWDGVKCVVQESRRRKKISHFVSLGSTLPGGPDMLRAKGVGLGLSLDGPIPPQPLRMATGEYGRQGSISNVAGGNPMGPMSPAAPGMLFQQNLPPFLPDQIGTQLPRMGVDGGPPWAGPSFGPNPGFDPILKRPHPIIYLPNFIKPLPAKLGDDDMQFLYLKGALLIPAPELQNALLKAYVEFVHPYMPLLELHEFLEVINNREQRCVGKISLLLYHAVMFAAVAFVDSKYLRDAGYQGRKAARKAFFGRVRLLYDMDCEGERHVLVQAVLLMTYWYETPDDQKDTWHWMGVAISLAHTIGLHRNPANIKMMEPRKQKLFKRIWWSCFMRDRLIALGMRRPTRIQDEDFDVPMLEEGDFEIKSLPDNNNILGEDCKLIRDTGMQRQLALMCIEKARLCVCISHMLKVQYSVLSRDGMRPENTTASTMMLFPNKAPESFEGVLMLDRELREWYRGLPECCNDRSVTEEEVTVGSATVALQRALLHMVYQATVAALHRPQFLPASPDQGHITPTQIQELARTRVYESAHRVIGIATELRRFKLDKYLPTTGVTVILPAMIIHLFEMKNPDPEACQAARQRFSEGMGVLRKLQERYAAADFAAKFLEAAFNKLSVVGGYEFEKQPNPQPRGVSRPLGAMPPRQPDHGGAMVIDPSSSPLPDNAPYLTPTEIHLYQHDNPFVSRESGLGAVGPRTPPTDSESEHQGDHTPASNISPTQRMPEATGTVCPQQTNVWDPCPMPMAEQYNMDSDFEVNQWLQFPAEGVSNSDEAMIQLFSNSDVVGDGGSHSYDWMKQHTQQSLQPFQHNLRIPEIADLTIMDISTAGQAA